MTNTKPATPSKEATPGDSESGGSQPSNPPTSANDGDKGNQQEGTVTITNEEYRNLQRNTARLQSFQKRAQFEKAKPSSEKTIDLENEDPELVDQLRKTQETVASLQRENFKEKLANRTREILEKEEFKNLPPSTRKLILKNPAVLTNADDIEEAVLDIEDFVREESASEASAQKQGTGPQQDPKNPEGHETPANVSASTPAPAGATEMEDTSSLTGTNRSRAVLRNLIRKRKSGNQ